MKKIIYISIAALLALASCSKAEIDPEVQSGTAAPGSITAVIEKTPDTKTTFGWDENNKIYNVDWSYGDELSVFMGNHQNLRYELTTLGSMTGVFSPVGSTEGGNSPEMNYDVAFYPYQENASVLSTGDDEVSLSVDIPARQSASGGFPMVAVNDHGRSSNFTFRNVMGGLYFVIKGFATITRVELYGNNGEVLCGPATVTASHSDAPSIEITGDGKLVYCDTEFSIDENTSKVLYFGIPPMTFSKGFTLKIYDSKGNVFEKTTDKELVVKRSVITPVTTIEFPYVDSDALVQSVYALIGIPNSYYSNTPDSFGILMSLFCSDVEGADLVMAESSANWFNVQAGYIRNPRYREMYIRFSIPLRIITDVNRYLQLMSEAEGGEIGAAKLRVLRAYAYMNLAERYQFTYSLAQDRPCVPIVMDENMNTQTPLTRATVKEVYDYILEDLDVAIHTLQGYSRTSRADIDARVAYGLRARVNLIKGEYNRAIEDAEAAIGGDTPASRSEVSRPSFMDISEHNWIWGFDMTEEMAGIYLYATTSSWIRSFSEKSYSTWGAVYSTINQALYDKISSNDVRKGWWVDENLYSPLLNGLDWYGSTDIARLYIQNVKQPFIPYTNVKFGCDPIGTSLNAEDFPLMRVEEMILVKAEAYARLGNEASARTTLDSFVSAYRQPGYASSASGTTLLDEIWFQRRVELWGEGFALPDILRLNKPLVRIPGGNYRNVPEAFAFNLPAGYDGFLLVFPENVMSYSPELVQNPMPGEPYSGMNPDLLDGVTD